MPGGRPDRGRQDDAAAGRLRPRPALLRRPARGHRHGRGSRHAHPPAARPRRCRRRCPAGPRSGLRRRDGRGRARLRHGTARAQSRGDAGPRGGDARPPGPGGPAGLLRARPVGRGAAARRDRCGAHRPPARAGARRAHLGPGPGSRRGRPRRADQARARPRPHRARRGAPARACRPVRRPDRHGRGRRHGPLGGGSGDDAREPRRPADRRAGTDRRLGPAADVRA